MTLTPTFHFVCRYCGTEFELTGERITPESIVVLVGMAVTQSFCDTLDAADVLSDTCRDCMLIHHKQAAQERDFQAEQDMK